MPASFRGAGIRFEYGKEKREWGAGPAESPVAISGVVARIASEVIDGNTVYWLSISDRPGLVLSATNRLGPQVALTRPGDTVRVTAQGAAGGVLTVTDLENPAVLSTPLH